MVEINGKTTRRLAAIDEIGVKKYRVFLKANFNHVIMASDGVCTSLKS